MTGKDKKKILHIVEAMGGGVFTYLVELANEMSDEFDITIAFGMRKETPQNYSDYFNKNIGMIRVENFTRNLNPIKDFKAYLELKKIIKELNPDIIHMHSSKAGAIGRLLFHSKERKMFYTPHGYSFLRNDVFTLQRMIYKFAEKLCGKKDCLTVACGESEWEQSKMVTKHSTFISNGINIRKMQKDLENVNMCGGIDTANKKGFTVYTVGRINHQKWTELFNEIAEKLPHIHFVWIGDGDMRDKLTQPNITVTGWLENSEAMKLAMNYDVFLLASRYEGLPISLLEAMYMKKICVVSNVVGNKDVVKNGQTGFVCNHVDEFVHVIADLEKSIDKTLVENAYREIIEHYNSDWLCNRYRELYNESVNK